MALATCRECGAEVSTRAKYCPRCGVSKPVRSGSLTFLYGLVILVALVIALGQYDGKKTAGPSSNSSAVEKEQFLLQHSDDPKALEDRFDVDAQSTCSVGADDYLKSIAQYDFKWDNDATGFFGAKFDKVGLTSPGSDMLTLISTRAKLSNVFGAFAPIKFYCLYNARTGSLVRYSQTNPADDVSTTSENSPPEVTSDNKSVGDISRSDKVGSGNHVASSPNSTPMPNSAQDNNVSSKRPEADNQLGKNAFDYSNRNTETPAANGITTT
jgi:hypothetical protein